MHNTSWFILHHSDQSATGYCNYTDTGMSYRMCMSVYVATTCRDLIFRSGKNGGRNSLLRILSWKTLSKQCTEDCPGVLKKWCRNEPNISASIYGKNRGHNYLLRILSRKTLSKQCTDCPEVLKKWCQNVSNISVSIYGPRISGFTPSTPSTDLNVI